MSKIYHYTFNVFNDRTDFKVVLRELTYAEGNYGRGRVYQVRTPYSVLKLTKGEIGQVHHGKSVLLFKRDDKKAIDIFIKYLNKKIDEAQNIVDNYNGIVGKLQNITVKEEEY